MNLCPKCAALNDDNALFCTGCGTPIEKKAEPAPQAAPVASTQQPYGQSPYQQQNAYPQYTTYQQQSYYGQQPLGYTRITESMLPPELKPLSMWQYIGYGFLFGLPFAGFIILLISAFGSDKNVNLKNYARSILVMYAISFVFVIIISICMAMFGLALDGASYY